MPLSQREKDNLLRWNHTRPFYETYDVTWSDSAQGLAGWHRFNLIDLPDQSPRAKAEFFLFDSKASKMLISESIHPLKESRIEKELFYFSVGESAIFDRGTRGALTSAETSFLWELEFEDSSFSLRHFPSFFYLLPSPGTKILSPYASTLISGDLTVNQKKIEIDKAPASQRHLWSHSPQEKWKWARCNTFKEDPHFVFEAFQSDTLLLFFFDKEESYALNAPLHWVRNQSEGDFPHWHFEGQSQDFLFVGDLLARNEETITTGFSSRTASADLQIQILKKENKAWVPFKTLTAPRSAFFEATNPWDSLKSER